MPAISTQYAMPYFKRGSLYSGTSDFRRFVTLDYNMESYVGITGVGVISGWGIEEVSGIQIQINPGNGIIQGYAVESPYDFKKRSEMVIPEREVEVVNTDPDQAPEPNLTSAEKAVYVSVIQDYNPTYNPNGRIENAYVKTVTPYVMNLFDNMDNYIHAVRVSGTKSYPLGNDLAVLVDSFGDEPDARNYADHQDYLAAKLAYDTQLQLIHDYEWRASSDNKFTTVSFVNALQSISTSTHLLLARVVTRNGAIQTIDTSGVDSLENMQGQITKFARSVLSDHRHGGSGAFDPPKIKLETDIRSTVLTSASEITQTTKYNVLSSNMTGTAEGHKHTYYLDADGNGYTAGVIGTQIIHFHKISGGVVGTNEFTEASIDDHTHTVPAVEYSEWTDDNAFRVYINDELFGDETSSNIIATPAANKLTLEQGVGVVYNTYTSSFNITIRVTDSENGEVTNEVTTYSFSNRTYSVLSFMLKMALDFGSIYGNNDGVSTILVSDHPFVFEGDTPDSIAGVSELVDQCSSASAMLVSQGDQFTFTPKASNNVTVVLLEAGSSGQKVTLEVLGNTEVSGVLDSSHILYLNASKILLGTFDIAQIPFIDHVGRMGEVFIPFQQSIASSDGIKYSVIPRVTGITMDHSHNLFLDLDGDGVTQQLFIGEDPVYYGTGSDGQTSYLIAHLHGVTNNTVLASDSDGLTLWQNDLNSSNANSASHIHDVIIPTAGDPKTVYSIQEDKRGNIYAGTASGFYMIPNDEAYLFIINGERYHLIGNDLWTLLLEAKNKYESDTNIPLSITSAVYTEQVALAEESLTNHGDSYILYGVTGPSLGRDEIMIKRLKDFEVPHFKYVVEKYPYEVKDGETVSGVKHYLADTGELIVDYGSLDDDAEILQMTLVQRDFNDTTIWSMALREDYSPDPLGEPDGDVSGVEVEDLFVLGSDILSKQRNLHSNFSSDWISPNVPSNAGSLRKVVKTIDNSLWIPTSRGLFVSRPNQNGRMIQLVDTPGFTQDIKDVVEVISGSIMCVSSDGIFETLNGGLDWTTVFTVRGGFNQILKDIPLNDLYAVSNERDIYKSEDNGATWIKRWTKPSGNVSNLFAFNGLFLSKDDGLYKLISGEWEKVFDERVYCFKESYDLQSMYVGCHNSIYQTTGGLTYSLVYSFVGFPLPVIYLNNVKQYFGYAYNSIGNSFHFNDFTYLTEDAITSVIVDCNKWIATEGPWNITSVIVDCNKWIATEGPWNAEADYEVFVDNKLIVSTLNGTDLRGSGSDTFVVSPESGYLDFSASSNLISAVDIYDSAVQVSNAYGFSVGDKVVIRSQATIGIDVPDFVTVDVSESYRKSVEEYADRVSEVTNMFVYTTIDSIIGNFIFMSERFDKVLEIPATINKVASVEGSTDIVINIYDSPLTNQGINLHNELEDKLSTFSDTRPYLLNNSFLSNLLQLTQAVRYVYPDIDSEFKQTKFYDFHYSWIDGQELPNIDEYIDVDSSDIYNQTVYNSDFIRTLAKSINKLFIGYGSFANYIIAATDIGLFWSKIANGLEGNWFYVNTLRLPVYDIIIMNNDTIYAGTELGLYSSTDMSIWTLETSPSVYYPIQRLGLRWLDRDTVSIPSHSATFTNDSYSSPTVGYIKANSNIYNSIKANRSVRVTGAGDLDGNYPVVTVQPNRLTINGPFASLTADVTYPSVTINTGAWWEQFDEGEYTGTADITNTLLAGGKDRISYKVGEGTWNEAGFGSLLPKFSVSDFLSVSSGVMLASATGESLTEDVNYVFKSSDVGRLWSLFHTLEEVRGTITNSSTTSSGHTELIVTYTYPSDYIYIDGILNLRSIAIFKEDSNDWLYQGYVIWNEIRNGVDKLIVFSQDAHSIFVDNDALVFKVLPVAVKSLSETNDRTILYGTDAGIYTDKKTTVVYNQIGGEIKRVGTQGTVNNIDLKATIKSVSKNTSTSNVVLSIITSSTVHARQLVAQTLHITDLDPIGSFLVVSNSVKSVAGEVVVEIDQEYNGLWLTYVGKSIVVSPAQSVVYIDFDYDVENGAYDGGKLYVISDQNDNLGESYNIISNTSNSIVVSESIVPLTTFVGGDVSGNNSLVNGQRISLVDSTGNIYLYVSFNAELRDNQFAGSTFDMFGTQSLAANITTLKVYSHTKDVIVLKPFSSTFAPVLGFAISDRFNIRGNTFEKLNSFNTKKTSTDSDHYHTLNILSGLISGEVDAISLATTGATLTISDVSGWDASILDSDTTILSGAKIRFYNPNDVGVSYHTTVNTATISQLNVVKLNSSMWNVSGYKGNQISDGWKWEIDAENYGYTDFVVYDNFVVEAIGITSDVAIGDENIEVEDTSGMVAGDKINIVDGFGTIERHLVSSITDANNFVIETPTDSEFRIQQNARVEVLRDSFANNHVHQIKKNEVKMVLVEDYNANGYPSRHSHRCLPYLSSVNDVVVGSNNLIAIGSDSIIYKSLGNGESWSQMTDLNLAIEGGEKVTSVSSATLYGNDPVVGTTNGYMFSPLVQLGVVRLEKPSV